ncbi:helix-turn-helix domain-containing protein, partial [Micromonospora sp. CPCC 205371]|nr:helix-turn-helix domain-containing protein [Micromonospora sp. CPCC 205371]
MDTKTAKPDPTEVVAETLRACGDLTAAALAEKIGMGYSTVTAKLRTLEDAGRAGRVQANGRTFWRLTTPPAQAPAVEAGADTNNTDTDSGRGGGAAAGPPRGVGSEPCRSG